MRRIRNKALASLVIFMIILLVTTVTLRSDAPAQKECVTAEQHAINVEMYENILELWETYGISQKAPQAPDTSNLCDYDAITR